MRGIVEQARSVVLLLSLAAGASRAMSAQDQQPAPPDNTKQNKTEDMTADNQKENKADRITTQKIRKSIMADKSLSSYAHNVKSDHHERIGHPQRSGPPNGRREVGFEAKATQVAGAGNVMSELTIAPKN